MLSFLITVLVLAPFLPLLLWSFSGKWFFPAPVPTAVSMRAWTYIFQSASHQILPGLFHSFGIAAVTSLLSVAIGLPAGRALGIYRFYGKPVVAFSLLAPVLVPPLSTAMALHFWFLKLGLAETHLGVILIHLSVSLPYAVFVLWGRFSGYDPEVEEQARSLGAGPVSVFFRITLPWVAPGVLAAGLFAFLLSWSQYLGTLVIGGGRILTLPVLLFSLMQSGDRPVAAAVSVLFVLPALLVLFVSAKKITGSLT